MSSAGHDSRRNLRPSPPIDSLNGPHIFTPQPQSLLKRQFLQSFDDQDEVHESKRQRLQIFVNETPEPLTRSRSDSFLLRHKFSGSRPASNIKPPIRYEDDLQYTTTKSLPSSTPSVQGPPTPASQMNLRTAQPTYRNELKRSGIAMIGSRKAQSDLFDHGRGILDRLRDSPELSDEDAEAAAELFETLRHQADEGVVTVEYARENIIPYCMNDRIISGCSQPFNTAAIPSLPGAIPLPAPKPHQFFAYSSEAFSNSQMVAMDRPTLSPFIQPVATGYLPFFIVEFKSTATGGTSWVAENQAATGGAVCVNSLETLFSVIDQTPNAIDTISFSCIMNERSAAFWLHYCERESGRFLSVELKHCYLERPTEIKAIRTSIKNIVDWAIKDRLPKIWEKLSQCQPTFINEHGKRVAEPSVMQQLPKRRS